MPKNKVPSPIILRGLYGSPRVGFADVKLELIDIEIGTTGAGRPSIIIKGRDLSDTSRKATKTKNWYVSKFEELIDPFSGNSTKEIRSVIDKILVSIGRSATTEWPMTRSYSADVDPNFSFHPADKSQVFAADWFFFVTSAHRDALDIKYFQFPATERAPAWRGWMQGRPPVLSFMAGDIFHAPSSVPRMTWGEQVRLASHVIQIVDATPDSVSGDESETIVSGQVVFDLYRPGNDDLGMPERHTAKQADLFTILKNGWMDE